MMEIKLEKVKAAEKEILFRLLQYSLYEESLGDLSDLNENALFDYPWFEYYFTEKEREAYFIKECDTDRLLGFTMINTYVQKCSYGHSIAEFMVLPKFRRNHIGKKAAFQCFVKHEGNWEVSPAYGSEQAYLFWKNIIGGYTDGNYRYEDGIFCFAGTTHKTAPYA